jgi:DNA-binding MarR family transcriptional regulator
VVSRPMAAESSLGPSTLPDHILRWLEAAQGRIVREIDPLLSEEARTLGMRRIRILQLIPPAGIRQTDLASRALVTKQGLGPVIDELESQGLIERVVDPSDARAWIVTVTTHGAQVAGSLDSALATFVAGLADEVGSRDAAAFLRVLRAIGTGTEQPIAQVRN